MLDSLTTYLINKTAEALWSAFAEDRARRQIESRADDPIARLSELAGGFPTSIDERLEKIERARVGLQEAAAAVAELEALSKLNKVELTEALQQLDRAHEQRASAEREVEAMRAILAVDVDAFRKVAGVPNDLEAAKARFRERLIGFLLGVVASVAASGVWWAMARYWPLLKS